VGAASPARCSVRAFATRRGFAAALGFDGFDGFAAALGFDGFDGFAAALGFDGFGFAAALGFDGFTLARFSAAGRLALRRIVRNPFASSPFPTRFAMLATHTARGFLMPGCFETAATQRSMPVFFRAAIA
jgi:hypothetical protein